jgi:RecB family exonuclease
MAMSEAPIKAWSWSRLDVFERCPYRAYLQYALKQPGAQDQKSLDAMNRGSKVHKDAELFVQGELSDLPKELKKFERAFRTRAELAQSEPEKVVVEEEWAFTTEWATTGWWDDDAWLRQKLDLMIWLDDEKTAAELVDHKTGKKEGNEVKHGQQGQLSVLCAFMRFPSLQIAKIQFDYLDQGKSSLPKTYTRDQAMTFLPTFDRRARALTSATKFSPRPNRINCAWCPFGPSRGDGSCEYGVEI